MRDPRNHGSAPFGVAVIHGGPGAAGEMAPVARELAPEWGVLEPFQTAMSLQGQVKELSALLEAHAALPATLVGFSWGAWLSFIVAAHHPTMVKELILVGSGPFEHRYVDSIEKTRLSRLSEAERVEYVSIIERLRDPAAKGKPEAFARLGALAAKTDAYDSIVSKSGESGSAGAQGNAFHDVLQEAVGIRRSGKLLELAKHIQCPVVAIHGDHDPHPAEGVQEPLSSVLKNFQFVLLENCGHKPWIERQAREAFYRVLREQLRKTHIQKEI